ncbi:uroporphyrinogen-III synthase [Fodinicurvata sp. EGI_FJ10296]|uniref:uroporphyrinogen-III synthase n=1 Tax=Fodinicurvata sp. EGI_FJ10296 TaxID=3231908 RepID=UPI003455F9FA
MEANGDVDQPGAESRWIVTRPLPDAEELADRLEEIGVRPLISPALAIVPLTPPAVTERIDGVIFTSRNGVRFGAQLAPDRSLRVFAVGEATAEEARRAGFTNVLAADGDVQSVAALIADTLAPSGRTDPLRLLHPAGAHRAGDLDRMLSASGIRVDSVSAYTAEPATGLSEEAYGSLVDGTVAGVLLFSPRTAALIAHLVTASGMDDRLRGVYAVCLSGNVADQIRHLPWRNVVVARARSTEAVLDAVSHLPSKPPARQRG